MLKICKFLIVKNIDNIWTNHGKKGSFFIAIQQRSAKHASWFSLCDSDTNKTL